MRTPIGIASIALFAPALLSCGQGDATLDVDPQAGRDCFELHLPLLPSGTQYEGIEHATGDRLTIRVMTGVEVTTVSCSRNRDGTHGKPGELR